MDIIDVINAGPGRHMGWRVTRMEDIAGAPPEGEAAGALFLSLPVVRACQAVSAMTALSTWLFGGFGKAKGFKDKKEVERVKKGLDAVATHTLSEGLYAVSKLLPRDVIFFVAQGEGVMEKSGSEAVSPNLGFGRIYAQPETASRAESYLNLYMSERGDDDEAVRATSFKRLMDNLASLGLRVVSLVVDTLENTSRSAAGERTGPMVVVHYIDAPLNIRWPYESYALTTTLTADVARHINKPSFTTPTEEIVRAIRKEYPGVPPGNIQVFTLRGKSRFHRLGEIWSAWGKEGVHFVEDGDRVGPERREAFTNSGTYAPNYLVGCYEVDGEKYYFINEGYAALAEAFQGIFAAEAQGKAAIAQVILPEFLLPTSKEYQISKLDPRDPSFELKLRFIVEAPCAIPHHSLEELHEHARRLKDRDGKHFHDYFEYVRDRLVEIEDVGFRLGDVITARKLVYGGSAAAAPPRVMAVDAMIGDDPYSSIDGIREAGEGAYEVCVRTSVRAGVSMTTRFTIAPSEKIDTTRRRSRPFLDNFLEIDWNADKYVFKAEHVGLVKNSLKSNYYYAVDIDKGNYYVRRDKLIEQLGEARADKFITILLDIKAKAGTALQWLNVVMDDPRAREDEFVRLVHAMGGVHQARRLLKEVEKAGR